jgi:hypothetical protein
LKNGGWRCPGAAPSAGGGIGTLGGIDLGDEWFRYEGWAASMSICFFFFLSQKLRSKSWSTTNEQKLTGPSIFHLDSVLEELKLFSISSARRSHLLCLKYSTKIMIQKERLLSTLRTCV